MALAVGCGCMPTCGGSNWTCLMPPCVAMAVDVIGTHIIGGGSWIWLRPSCPAVAVGCIWSPSM